MSKTEKISARVLPARHERYVKAAQALRLDELSDFIRRACDDLADAVLEPTPSARMIKPRPGRADVLGKDLAKDTVTPRPRRKG